MSRAIASAGCTELPHSATDLLTALKSIQTTFQSSCFNESSGRAILDQVSNLLYHVNLETLQPQATAQNGPELIREIFNTEVILRGRLSELVSAQRSINDLVPSWRNVVRAGRVLADGIGESLYASNQQIVPALTNKALTGNAASLMVVEPSSAALTLQSGDVLMIRGLSFNELAIARIGDVEAQFSHLAFVYVEGQKKWLVESLIETGLIATPLETELQHLGPRIAVLRHHNSELAREAAQIEFIRARQKGTPVAYNLSIDKNVADRATSAQVIYDGFFKASQKKLGVGHEVRLPMFVSQVTQKNPDFLESLDVSPKGEVFQPNDLEFDLNFALVAEWRDWHFMKDVHMKDVILSSLFQWMDRFDFQYHRDTFVISGPEGVLDAHHWPSTTRSSAKKSAPNLGARAQAYLAMLEFTASQMYDLLKQDVNRYDGSQPHLAMHPREMAALLDPYRQMLFLHEETGPMIPKIPSKVSKTAAQ
jgi:hypothetical protein